MMKTLIKWLLPSRNVPTFIVAPEMIQKLTTLTMKHGDYSEQQITEQHSLQHYRWMFDEFMADVHIRVDAKVTMTVTLMEYKADTYTIILQYNQRTGWVQKPVWWTRRRIHNRLKEFTLERKVHFNG